MAAASLIQASQETDTLGIEADVDALVHLAEEAHKAAPSLGTQTQLREALLARAGKALSAQEPEYLAMVKGPGVRSPALTWCVWPVARRQTPNGCPGQCRCETRPGADPG